MNYEESQQFAGKLFYEVSLKMHQAKMTEHQTISAVASFVLSFLELMKYSTKDSKVFFYKMYELYSANHPELIASDGVLKDPSEKV